MALHQLFCIGVCDRSPFQNVGQQPTIRDHQIVQSLVGRIDRDLCAGERVEVLGKPVTLVGIEVYLACSRRTSPCCWTAASFRDRSS